MTGRLLTFCRSVVHRENHDDRQQDHAKVTSRRDPRSQWQQHDVSARRYVCREIRLQKTRKKKIRPAKNSRLRWIFVIKKCDFRGDAGGTAAAAADRQNELLSRESDPRHRYSASFYTSPAGLPRARSRTPCWCVFACAYKRRCCPAATVAAQNFFHPPPVVYTVYPYTYRDLK